MFLHVTSARYISDYKLWLEFNDGAKGEVDLADELSGEVFSPLSDLKAFKNFTLDDELDTIVWSNGADFAPEFLRGLLQEGKIAV